MSNKHNYQFLRDPLALGRVLWPHVRFYDRQKELIYSVWHNKLTICVAGNMLGKDFTAAFIALTFFLTRTPCRTVTTSVDGDQLAGVLWGEMRRLIQESKVPLHSYDGGPLLVNDLYIRKVHTHGEYKGEVDGLSYLMGKVAKKGEGMLGHHIAETGDCIPRTLFMGDEASGLEDETIDKAETWYDRGLLIGNAYPCSNRFFRESEPDQGGGDKKSGRKVKYWEGVSLAAENAKEPIEMVDHYLRKIIRIPCAESPNVKYGMLEAEKGLEPSGTMLVPGVMSYWKYRERMEMWDEVKKCIQLNAQFYKGAELLLFPPQWLNASEELEPILNSSPYPRTARAIGCDPGEGTAESAWYVVDDDGILDEVALQTPNTTDIPAQTVHLMKKWGVPAEMVMLDRGGGGKQHADYLREMGYDVRTIGFGETVTPPPRRGLQSIGNRIEEKEEQYTYVSRRAEMYHHASMLLDPALGPQETIEPSDYTPIILEPGKDNLLPERLTRGRPRFCIPRQYKELRRQLAPIPKMYDKEGRIRLPPKNKQTENSNEKTLTEIIGCSPDRADALVVALYCRDYAPKRVRAGAA